MIFFFLEYKLNDNLIINAKCDKDYELDGQRQGGDNEGVGGGGGGARDLPPPSPWAGCATAARRVACLYYRVRRCLQDLLAIYVLSKNPHPRWGKLHLLQEISMRNLDPGTAAAPGVLPSKVKADLPAHTASGTRQVEKRHGEGCCKKLQYPRENACWKPDPACESAARRRQR